MLPLVGVHAAMWRTGCSRVVEGAPGRSPLPSAFSRPARLSRRAAPGRAHPGAAGRGKGRCRCLYANALRARAPHDTRWLHLLVRCVPPLVSGRTLMGMWRCGPSTSQGAEGGQCAANLCAMHWVALEVFRRGHVPSLGATMARPMIAAAGADDASDALRRPLSLALIAAVTRVGALAARRQSQTRTWRVVSVQAKPWIGPWMQSLRPALAPRDIRH
jgi:hypothetical protein